MGSFVRFGNCLLSFAKCSIRFVVFLSA